MFVTNHAIALKWWNSEFLQENPCFLERKSKSVICSQKTSESLTSIIVKERVADVTLCKERHGQGRSFLKSDESELLTVSL